MAEVRVRAVFSDIGGVLGTNGWDGPLRTRLCDHFGIDQDEIEERHRLMFDSFERGYLKFDEYLTTVFLDRPRSFTVGALRQFVYDASTPWPDNLDFLRGLRKRNNIKVGLISNEGEGITEHRIEKFGLRDVCDFMVISHFTRLRKPDPAIWGLARHLAAVKPGESIYIDDRAAFAEVAEGLGFQAIHHTTLAETRERIAALGLRVSGNE